MKIDATGVILAGGRSRRFGSNKGLAVWDGRPLIEKIANDVAAIFSRTLLVTNVPEEFNFLAWNTVADLRPGLGPLAGLEAALAAADTEYIFLTGCDLPCLSAKIIRHLFAKRAGFKAVIPVGAKGAEPLCAIYRRDLLVDVRAMLDQMELKISRLTDRPGVLLIPGEKTSCVDPDPNIFANANTPGELARLRDQSASAEKGRTGG